MAQAALDVAEAAVIELALHEKIGRVCIDEVKSRRGGSWYDEGLLTRALEGVGER